MQIDVHGKERLDLTRAGEVGSGLGSEDSDDRPEEGLFRFNVREGDSLRTPGRDGSASDAG